jgi:hypothetical protein
MDGDEEIIKSLEFRMKNLEKLTHWEIKRFLNSKFSIHNLRLKGVKNGKTGNIIHGTMGGPSSCSSGGEGGELGIQWIGAGLLGDRKSVV